MPIERNVKDPLRIYTQRVLFWFHKKGRISPYIGYLKLLFSLFDELPTIHIFIMHLKLKLMN